MHRPALPRAWRLAVGASGVLTLFYAILSAPGYAIPIVYHTDEDPLFVLWGAIGAALALDMLRHGGIERRAGIAAAGGSLLVAFLARAPAAALPAIGILAPATLAAARRSSLATPVIALGGGATAFALVALARAGPFAPADVQARGIIFASVLGVLAMGLLAYAFLARPEPGGHLTRRGRWVVVALGVALLAVSWATGGRWGDAPLSMMAFLALAAPPLIRWRAAPVAAALVLVLAALAFVPIGTCTSQARSVITGESEPFERDVILGGVALRGPFWDDRGGFSSLRTTCTAPQLALGALWAGALLAAGAWSARKPAS